MNTSDYYNYSELISAVDANETPETLAALGEWFSQYGDMYWNGECWDIDGNRRLYPIYAPLDEECEQWEITGYEIR